MQLNVYADINGFTNIGALHTQYDRISYVDLKIPVITTIGNNNDAPATANASACVLYAYQPFCKPTDYLFSIKRLSRGELAYRQSGLTHLLICDGLEETGKHQLYTRLTKAQAMSITYQARGLFWQTKDFWATVYKTAISYIIPIAIGAIGTLCIFLFSGQQQEQERPPAKPQKTNPVPKNNKMGDTVAVNGHARQQEMSAYQGASL